MNPEKLFCPNIDCLARGQTCEGNITVHSQKEKRCYCQICGKTFAASRGTLYYRLRTDPHHKLWVIVLLAYGCPVPAADRVRQMALCRPLLLAVDGLPGYLKAFGRTLRSKVPRFGRQGRAKWQAWSEVAIVQVIKRRLPSGLEIERAQGDLAQVTRLIAATQNGSGVINTAYIERLNATFRAHLSWLSRRTRRLAQQSATLTAGMFVIGCFYNLCDAHHSLRCRLSVGEFGHRWIQRMPALAAGLTEHIWTADELLMYRVPPHVGNHRSVVGGLLKRF